MYELEFIEIYCYWFKEMVIVYINDSVNMFNLVEGESVVVESIDDFFVLFEVYYGEIFIVFVIVGIY